MTFANLFARNTDSHLDTPTEMMVSALPFKIFRSAINFFSDIARAELYAQ